mgnify:CR=1 FL=1
MKKKVLILGSTGSIGKTTINIIKRNFTKFKIVGLVANKNYKLLAKQANILKPKFVFINDSSKINYIKKNTNYKNVKVISDFNDIEKNIEGKVDFLVSGISGFDGLKYNLILIKKAKEILYANKESIICGWNLIKKELIKNKTILTPIDSEHFAINEILKKENLNDINDITITASGGPFFKKKISQFKDIKISEALNHPKWKMGKKISIDSATLMNKIFEVVEAFRIFNIPKNKIKILIHPEALVHAMISFNNGTTKALIHINNMEIPISSALKISKFDQNDKIKLNKILNQKLSFFEIESKRFPCSKILKEISFENKLFDTLIISANDSLVDLFLKNKISFTDINLYLHKIINNKFFDKYRYISPKNFNEINTLNQYVRLNIKSIISIK